MTNLLFITLSILNCNYPKPPQVEQQEGKDGVTACVVMRKEGRSVKDIRSFSDFEFRHCEEVDSLKCKVVKGCVFIIPGYYSGKVPSLEPCPWGK